VRYEIFVRRSHEITEITVFCQGSAELQYSVYRKKQGHVTIAKLCHNPDNYRADFYRFLPQTLQHLPQITVGSGLDHLRISPR